MTETMSLNQWISDEVKLRKGTERIEENALRAMRREARIGLTSFETTNRWFDTDDPEWQKANLKLMKNRPPDARWLLCSTAKVVGG